MKTDYSLVFYKQGHYSKKKLARLFDALPFSRKERILNLKDNPTYKEFLIVEYFLVAKKMGLSADQDFSYNEFGKPFVPNETTHFSISHSQNILVVAFSQKPIGVDIQHLLNFNDEVAALVCNDFENAQIVNSKNINLEFTKLWTQKESVVKMLGSTFYLDTKNILNNNSQVKIKSWLKKNYALSVCLLN